MAGKRIGYIRVSSADQNTGRQLDGQQLDKTFVDKASGKDRNRPELQAMLGYIRDDDTVVVHSMDRLARNLDDLRRLVQAITDEGAQVVFVKEGLTFTGEDTPMATLLLNVMGAVAEFERAIILERQREGVEKAKARGVYKGRKPSLTPEQAHDLRMRAAAGESKTKLAKEFRVHRDTVYTYLKTLPDLPEDCRRPPEVTVYDELLVLRSDR